MMLRTQACYNWAKKIANKDLVNHVVKATAQTWKSLMGYVQIVTVQHSDQGQGSRLCDPDLQELDVQDKTQKFKAKTQVTM